MFYTQSLIDAAFEAMMESPQPPAEVSDVLEIKIRQVGTGDHIDVVKLFQVRSQSKLVNEHKRIRTRF